MVGECACDCFILPRDCRWLVRKGLACFFPVGWRSALQVAALGFPLSDTTHHRLHVLAQEELMLGQISLPFKLPLHLSSFPALGSTLPPDDRVVCCSPIRHAGQPHSALLIVLLGLLPFSLENSDSSSDEPRPCGGFPDPLWQRPSLPSSSGCPRTHPVG